MSKYEVTTLKKGLQILELLKEHDALTLTEITKQLELSKSTAFRMLVTLEEMGYIQKFNHHFEINHKMFSSHFEKRTAQDWIALKSPYKVAKDLGESFYIGRLDETNLVMTQVLNAPFTEPAREEIGNRLLVHQSALGKVILANLLPDAQKEVFKKLSLEKATNNTFNDGHLFVHHLDVIKKQGFAFDDEERVVGIRCIAVPLFKNNEVIASIAIAAPVERISRKNIKLLTHRLVEASVKIAREMEVTC